MENSQLQHLGKLLTGGEESALLARELMLGQGIWNAQGVIKCLYSISSEEITTDGLWRLKNLIEDRPDAILGYGRNDRIANLVTQWFDDHDLRKRMKAYHHNPTAPTTPTQTSAFGPSGV